MISINYPAVFYIHTLVESEYYAMRRYCQVEESRAQDRPPRTSSWAVIWSGVVGKYSTCSPYSDSNCEEASETDCDEESSETNCEEASSETYCEETSSENNCEEASSDCYCEKASSDCYCEEALSDCNCEEKSSDYNCEGRQLSLSILDNNLTLSETIILYHL